MNNKNVSYETYLKGFKAELEFDELDAICQTPPPKGAYYDYDTLLGIMQRKLDGEFTDEYFRDWLILASYALDYEGHPTFAYGLDGYAFCDDYEEPIVKEMISVLWDYNYRLINKDFVSAHKRDKLKIIYLRFEHCNWTLDSVISKAYFVDYETRRFDIRFLDSVDMDYDCNAHFCYIYDEREEENEGMEYSEEPRYLPEENQLISYFFDEKEEWVYDHNLSF